MDVEVAVVVVTYNSAEVIGDLLDSIPAAMGDVRGAVVVVDNESTDGTVVIVDARNDCCLLRAPNLGYSAGINRGAARIPLSEAILVLNPDARLHPGSVSTMLKTLRLTKAAVVAPRIVEPSGSTFQSLRREPTLARALGLGSTGRPVLSEHVTETLEYERQHVTDWALGAVLLLSRAHFDKLQGFDESFFLYSEETDYCLRARDNGWLTRYEPHAVAMHIGGQSGQSCRIHSMQILNRVRLYRRRHNAAASVLYYFLTVMSELSWVFRGHKQSLMAIRDLLRPSKRPAELNIGDRFIPR